MQKPADHGGLFCFICPQMHLQSRGMLHCLHAILLCALVLPAAAQSPASTQPSPDEVFQQIRDEAKREYLLQQGDLRELGEKRLTDLITFHRDGDFLAMEIKCDPTDEPLRFTLVPHERNGRVDIRASPEGLVTADVQIADFSKPGEVERQTSISLNPVSISVAAFIHRSLDSVSVQLFQTHDGNDILVQLIVQGESDLWGELNLHCKATTFQELRRAHGRELQKYVAPVLRDLGIEEQVFAPPAARAQQALGIGAEVDSKVLEALDPLLEKLESPDFRTRHTAALELRKLDRANIIALARADRSKWSLNRTAAVDALLADSDLPAKSDLTELANQPVFLIDCLYLDDPVIRKEAAARLERIAKRPLHLNLEEPIEKRVLAIDRLVDQFIPPTPIEQEQ